MNFEAIAKELLWFISGSTDSKVSFKSSYILISFNFFNFHHTLFLFPLKKLAEQNVHIWDANGSLAFLKLNNFNERKEGDLGPVYGFQWRHFGAKYIDSKTDYTGQGIDQLANLIDKIKTNPYDRRLLLCAWNVAGIFELKKKYFYLFSCKLFMSNFPKFITTL